MAARFADQRGPGFFGAPRNGWRLLAALGGFHPSTDFVWTSGTSWVCSDDQAADWVAGSGRICGQIRRTPAGFELHYRKVGAVLQVEGDINGGGRADFTIDVTGVASMVGGDFLL